LAYCTILSTYSPFKTTLSKRLLAQWAKTVVVILTLTRVRGSSVLQNYRSVDSNVSSCVSVDRYR